MVKTRRQAKNEQHATPPSPPSPPPKKGKQIEKMPLVDKQKLRERLRQKMLRGDLGCVERKSIDAKALGVQPMFVRQRLNCPICLQIMIRPVITHCGHTFCLPCIEQSLKYKCLCSLCRQPTTYEHIQQSKFIEKLIARVGEAAPAEERRIYRRRLEQFRQQDEERRVSGSVKVGSRIDFYSNGSWREGDVVQIDRAGQSTTLKVKSARGTHEFSLQSRLIAKHRCFTRQHHNMFDDPLGELWIRFDRMVPIFTGQINRITAPVIAYFSEDSDSDNFQPF